jgi:NADPH-dependent F420 reductase
VEGADNAECARRSDVVIIAVPWDGHAATLEALRGELAGKLVVDCVNPLGFDKQGAYALVPDEGSAAQQAAALLPDSRVTAAFHHLSAVLLQDPALTTGELATIGGHHVRAEPVVVPLGVALDPGPVQQAAVVEPDQQLDGCLQRVQATGPLAKGVLHGQVAGHLRPPPRTRPAGSW